MAKLYPIIKKLGPVGRVFDRQPFPSFDPANLPKRIYSYWHAGLDAAPEICRACADSWKYQNPDWEFVFLDEQSAAEILDPGLFTDRMLPVHYCDLLRIELLRRNGGVWADITTLCTKPLNDWLPMLFNQTQFFAFSRPAPDRVVSSWFLAATPDSEIMAHWHDLAFAYWKNRKAPPKVYFWLHYLFESGLYTSPAFRKNFGVMPRISANMCHVLQFGWRDGAISEGELSKMRYAPVQKLTHRSNLTVDDLRQILARR